MVGPLDSAPETTSPPILDGYISVQDAAEYSGYNIQYLRRMMQSGSIDGIKIGQVWLIKFDSLKSYVKQASQVEDRRFGPRSNSQAQLTSQQQ